MTPTSERSFTVQGRTGQKRREATRGDLVAATKRLLESGAPLARLSVERIVGEAGVNRTTFYRHFHDKQELVDLLAQEQVAWIEEVGASAGTGTELTRAAVEATVDEIVSRWAANRPVLAAVIELAEYDSRMSETWRAAMHEVGEVASALFRRQWAADGTAPQDPEMVSEVLTWMIERSCHQITRDPASRPRVAQALAEVIWRVLHPAPAARA